MPTPVTGASGIPRRRRSLRRASAVSAIVASGALVLSGCAASGDGGDAAKDVVNVVTPAQPSTLDPQISTESIMGEITGSIYETLVVTDENLVPQPMLAESFERSDDGLEYTFVLREGVKFHDGSELTASDVVDSMNRWTRVSIAADGAFDGSEWTEVDDYTVKLTVPTASFLHLLYLSDIGTSYPAIMPSEVIEEFGDEPVQDIVGTGPYTLKEWDADQRIVIEKWDDYQSVDAPSSGRAGAKDAVLNEVVFSFVPDAATRTMGMQSGQYDVTPELPFDGLTQFQEDPNLVLGTYTIGPINLVYSDRAGGPFENVVNRQAVNTALDRDPIMLASVGSEELYDLVHHNMTEPQQAIWDTEVGKAEFNAADTAAAKALLAEGGYAGEPVTLLVTRDYTEAYNAAVVVAEQLKGIGVDVKLEALEWASYFDKYKEGRDEWDLTIIPQGTVTDPTQTVGFLPNRAGYYDTPELHDLLARFRAAPTQDDATLIFDEMQQYIETYRPLTRLGDAHNVYAASKDLELPVFNSHFVWWNASWK
ncbi:ABC transporter substrate-binding protein [Agromyces mediolanus]|uniref:Peptide ABC transporter substrate-binding protein n=1 Tax=Agromyces mediolanus TaxID=41986 RepID=A0A918CB35_AGRME|nr:ABC transporter substrate-binding protein [Agromyces mediolanus]GGR13201.1 peptide ABC transporter substrate-binding protein [Agromyces mediolanus]GLJ72621.1 peptide ABC transporter substrate-binding protein [Agromyces mediolanus]